MPESGLTPNKDPGVRGTTRKFLEMPEGSTIWVAASIFWLAGKKKEKTVRAKPSWNYHRGIYNESLYPGAFIDDKSIKCILSAMNNLEGASCN